MDIVDTQRSRFWALTAYKLRFRNVLLGEEPQKKAQFWETDLLTVGNTGLPALE